MTTVHTGVEQRKANTLVKEKVKDVSLFSLEEQGQISGVRIQLL